MPCRLSLERRVNVRLSRIRRILYVDTQHTRKKLIVELEELFEIASKYELMKTGHLRFSHPEGGHDDVFWSTALAVLSSVQSPLPGKGVFMLPHERYSTMFLPLCLPSSPRKAAIPF